MTPRRTSKVDRADQNDQTLAALARDGDVDAAKVLYLRHRQHARFIALKYPDVRNDDWQSVYGVTLWACIASVTYSPLKSRFKTYFTRAFENALVEEGRREIRLEKAASRLAREPLDATGDDLSGRVAAVAKYLANGWRAERKRCNEREQWALITERMYVEERTISEVAEELGVPEHSVRNVLSRNIYPAFRKILGSNVASEHQTHPTVRRSPDREA
jgi:DNA-directed RNA polymerase specialized sigma24 family protein